MVGKDKAHIKKKARRVLPVLIALIIIGTLAYWKFTGNQTPENTIRASGTIEAIETDISPRVSGKIVNLLVDEGDRVKKGQLVAVLDDKDLAAQVEQAEGNLISAKARLAELANGTREEQIREAQANYRKALANAQGSGEVLGTVSESYAKSSELKARLASAEAAYKSAVKDREAAAARLALVKAGPRAEEIQRLKANLDQFKAQQKKAEEDYKRYSQLFNRGAISGQQLDQALAARDAGRANTQAAEAAYREALAGSRTEEIAEAQARFAQAEANVTGARETLSATRQIYNDRLESRQQLQSARTNYETAGAQAKAAKAELDLLESGARSEAIEAARGQVEQAKGALTAARTQLGHTRVYAPEDGVVTSKFREIGEFLTPGTPIVRTANLNRVWLRVYAPLPTLGKIKVGQTAYVHTDTYEGRVYKGRVMSISEEPEFTPKNVQTTEERVKLVYSIRIDVDNVSQELKPGMPADADIHVATDSVRG